jgi:ring-1,2-phenylacetyl-CoA epoxidase subunit PaaE
MFELEINEVIKETLDTISVSFNIPEGLKSSFGYKPGQYLTFEQTINGEKLKRSYSLCSNPFSDELPKVAIKRVADGRFSNYANDNFKAGDLIKVNTPIGNFFADIASYNTKQYVLFAGGSGITPVLSILKSVLTQEVNSKVTLIYANAIGTNIIFNDELASLAATYSDRFKRIDHIDADKGLITADLVKSYLGASQQADYYMCGPQGFMEIVEFTLNGLGVTNDKINKEYFKAKEKIEEADPEEVSEEIIDREVTIIVDDEESTFMVPADENILEAAIDNDLDPPYSCQAGVCTACRAMCVSGKVKMDEMEGLSDEEIEEGYVLACQAHPLTDNVKLEFSL